MQLPNDTLLVLGGPAVLVLFAVQYVALRIRDARATPQDPHLGRKAVLYFFFNLSVFVALTGLTVSSLDWFEYAFEPAVEAQKARQNGQPPPSLDPVTGQPLPRAPRDWFNDQQRLAAGLFVSGLGHALLFWAVARLATNDRRFPAVRRAFAGMRFVVAGLVTMTCSTVTVVTMFQRGETDYELTRTICAVAAVWAPTAVAHLVLMMWSSGWRRQGADPT